MKKFKKLLISVILVALVACSLIPISACGANWIEVQSVSYNYKGDTRIIRSTCNWETTRESITQTEYDNAPEENKIGNNAFESVYDFGYIDVDRQTFIADCDAKIGTVVYVYTYWYPYGDDNKAYFYFKYTFKSYILTYVKVNILENGCLEVDYNNKIISISPSESYEITYFEN